MNKVFRLLALLSLFVLVSCKSDNDPAPPATAPVDESVVPSPERATDEKETESESTEQTTPPEPIAPEPIAQNAPEAEPQGKPPLNTSQDETEDTVTVTVAPAPPTPEPASPEPAPTKMITQKPPPTEAPTSIEPTLEQQILQPPRPTTPSPFDHHGGSVVPPTKTTEAQCLGLQTGLKAGIYLHVAELFDFKPDGKLPGAYKGLIKTWYAVKPVQGAGQWQYSVLALRSEVWGPSGENIQATEHLSFEDAEKSTEVDEMWAVLKRRQSIVKTKSQTKSGGTFASAQTVQTAQRYFCAIYSLLQVELKDGENPQPFAGGTIQPAPGMKFATYPTPDDVVEVTETGFRANNFFSALDIGSQGVPIMPAYAIWQIHVNLVKPFAAPIIDGPLAKEL